MSEKQRALEALARALAHRAGADRGDDGVYFGFVLLVAYDKPLLGRLIAPGLSLGILLGALVIVSAWVLTWVYVRWANRLYDASRGALRIGDGTAGRGATA